MYSQYCQAIVRNDGFIFIKNCEHICVCAHTRPLAVAYTKEDKDFASHTKICDRLWSFVEINEWHLLRILTCIAKLIIARRHSI